MVSLIKQKASRELKQRMCYSQILDKCTACLKGPPVGMSRQGVGRESDRTWGHTFIRV